MQRFRLSSRAARVWCYLQGGGNGWVHSIKVEVLCLFRKRWVVLNGGGGIWRGRGRRNESTRNGLTISMDDIQNLGSTIEEAFPSSLSDSIYGPPLPCKYRERFHHCGIVHTEMAYTHRGSKNKVECTHSGHSGAYTQWSVHTVERTHTHGGLYTRWSVHTEMTCLSFIPTESVIHSVHNLIYTG